MNIDREFEAIAEYWSPRVIAEANGQYVKLAKVKGEFVWHTHPEEDEFFLVRKGSFIIRYRNGEEVTRDLELGINTVTYRPHRALDAGANRVRVSVRDRDGNVVAREWSFRVR